MYTHELEAMIERVLGLALASRETGSHVTDQSESVELIFGQRKELKLGLVTKLAKVLCQKPKSRLSRPWRLENKLTH